MRQGEEEFVPNGRAVWLQSDLAKVYWCRTCGMHVFSQHEGDEPVTIACEPDGHRLTWEVDL